MGLVLRRRRKRLLLSGGAGASSVFDGGSFELYSGSVPENAGSLLATGSIPSPAFDATALGERAKANTWQSNPAIASGNVGGLLLRTPGNTDRAWIPVVVAPSAGDVVAINAVDITIGQTVTIDTLVWTNP